MSSASNSVNRKLFTGDPPKVTGLSPKEGPPGTKITIRGENLGKSEDDLIGVSICDVDCLIWSEWKSSSKIIARTAIAYGVGDVIVFTKSGGIGTCTVQFKSIKDIISPTKETSVWVDEDDYFTYTDHRSASLHSPTSFKEEDPLGINVNNEDSNSYVVKSKLSESVFRDFFPEVTLTEESDSNFSNFSSVNFHPYWYLLENYNSINFNQLKNSLNYLKEKNKNLNLERPETGPINLLKPNVLAVIECLDALKCVNLSFKKDKQEIGPDLTHKIEESIKKATEQAHDIFDSVLIRKDTSDSTRNALNVLQRYRFLFNLPSTIEGNINKHQYEAAINDYLRAKSLFSDTNVQVFQRVYKEVELRIQAFRKTLKQELMENCKKKDSKRNIDEIKKYIRHLVSLNSEDQNVGWECVNVINESLLETLNKCFNNYVEKLDFSIDEGEKYVSSETVQFIKDFTHIFNTSFADLVKLGNSYINKELYSKENKQQLKNKELLLSNEIFQKAINLYVGLMRKTLLPEPSKNEAGKGNWKKAYDSNFQNEATLTWLPHCLRISTDSYNTLSTLELPCASMLSNMQQFIFDLRVHSLVCVFKQAASEVASLHTQENWDVQSDDNIGTRTQLPLLFEGKIEGILRLVRETILQQCTPDETDIFSKINVQGQMKQLAQNLLTAFVSSLEKTASSKSEDAKNLIVICNCQFTANHVINCLQESFDKYNYPDMSTVLKMVQSKFRELETRLLTAYIQAKQNKVKDAMQKFLAPYNSPMILPANSISFYVKETIMSVIEIQSDVYSYTPLMVRKILSAVIENTCEQISNVYKQINMDRIDENSNFQATLDLTAFQYVFDNPQYFQSIKASKNFTICWSNCLPLNDISHSQAMEKILKKFKTSMQLQLNAFKSNVDQVIIAL